LGGSTHPKASLERPLSPFGLKEGTNFMEYDLVYLRGDLLFWGARNIDGRGFDTEQNRPNQPADSVGPKVAPIDAFPACSITVGIYSHVRDHP